MLTNQATVFSIQLSIDAQATCDHPTSKTRSYPDHDHHPLILNMTRPRSKTRGNYLACDSDPSPISDPTCVTSIDGDTDTPVVPSVGYSQERWDTVSSWPMSGRQVSLGQSQKDERYWKILWDVIVCLVKVRWYRTWQRQRKWLVWSSWDPLRYKEHNYDV